MELCTAIDINRVTGHNVISSYDLESDHGKIWVRNELQPFSEYAGAVGLPCDSCEWRRGSFFLVEQEHIYMIQ